MPTIGWDFQSNIEYNTAVLTGISNTAARFHGKKKHYSNCPSLYYSRLLVAGPYIFNSNLCTEITCSAQKSHAVKICCMPLMYLLSYTGWAPTLHTCTCIIYKCVV